MNNNIINIIINLMIWPGKVSLSEFEKWWPGAKSHQRTVNVKTVMSKLSDHRSNLADQQIKWPAKSEILEIRDPDQMTCHMPNLSLKSHQKCEVTTWSDKAHFWYLPFPLLLFLPPSLFLKSQETRIPGLRECVGVIIPNPCTLNRTFVGS